MNIASQITAEDIVLLSETHFTELITKLLYAETSNFSELVLNLSIPSKENTADGGEDGRLELDDNFPVNQFIKFHKNFYQIKAYDVAPAKCASEVVCTINNNIKEIKPTIKQAITDGYFYIWYMKKSLSPKMRKDRINATKKAFNDHGILDANVGIIDADDLKNWVNHFPSLIAYVKFCNNQSLIGVNWLEQCPEYKIKYHSSKAMDKLKDDVLKYVKVPNSTDAIRIIGNSGIVKTHFIINVLSQDKYIENLCLYINCSDHSDISNIIDLVSNYKNSTCILILDNCSLHNHQRIQRLKAESASFKLISIDSNLEDDSYQEYRIINIISDNQVEAVKKILDTVIVGDHREMYLNSLAAYCDGYPLLANKVSLAIQKHGLDGLDIATLIDTSSVNKWLFEKIPELSIDNLKKVITGLSFFSYISFTDNGIIFRESEKEAADEQFAFLTKYFFDNMTQKEFKKICKTLIKMTFLEQKGTLIAVRPPPLAAYMIKDAINSNAIDLDDDFKPALQELNGSTSRAIEALEVALILQLKKVVTSGLKNVINIVNTVFGVKSPFSMAENILTSRGSSILRHLADIDPQLTVKLIQNIINPITYDEILGISGQIRRNIIWTLETLCYYKDTFHAAAQLLLSFAAAENESIANNATGQFIHMFQLFLPGTQANYKDRVRILHWGINHENNQYFIPILMKSITRAFYNHGSFTGNIRGAGDTKHLNEYQPTSNKEIIEYWQELLDLLINSFNTFTPDAVYKSFNDSILATLLESNQFDYIENFIKLFQKSNLPAPYTEIINNLKRLREFNKHIPLSKIDELLNLLHPQDLLGRIKLQVINPSYGFGNAATLEKNHYISEIANEILLLKDKKEYFELLINADSWLTSELGMQIGKINSEQAQNIFYEITDTFDLSNVKVSFISGILWGINDQLFINECFKGLATRDCINFVFNLSANIRINKEIFTILLDLKHKNNLPSEVFSKLNFSQVPSIERKWFINTLQELNSVGIYKIIDLLFANMNQTEMQTAEWLEYAEQLIKTNVFLICDQNNADYTLYAVLVKLIELKEDIVEQISSQLNDYCIKMLHNYPATHYWHNLFPILIDKCYTTIWNKYLGELFLQDWSGCFFISHILHLNSLSNSDARSKLLLEWCIQNKNKKAHILMARNMAIFDEMDQCVNFVIDLIKSFNEDTRLLDAIYSRMNEYSWQGDVSNYYLKCITQLENMKHKFIDNDFVLAWIEKSKQNFKVLYKSTKQEEDEFNLIASRH